MLHLRPGNVAARRQGIADDRHRACLQRGIDVAIAVGALALHGDKAPARPHPAAVVIQSGDIRIALLREILRAVQ